jgi:LmbE family N-acetylglucosaminyl deacetylase
MEPRTRSSGAAPAAPPARGDPGSPPQQPSVLLVTAHPDDEAMFFAPSLAHFAACGSGVAVLCLSNGAALLPCRAVQREGRASLSCLSASVKHPSRLRLAPRAGNADGLGRVREKELVAACARLQVRACDSASSSRLRSQQPNRTPNRCQPPAH